MPGDTVGGVDFDASQCTFRLIRNRDGVHARLAAMVANEIRGNPKQVIAAMVIAFERSVHAQQPIVRLLQQVVGKPAVARHSQKVDPHGPRRQVIERTKGLLVHLERALGFLENTEAFDVNKRHVVDASVFRAAIKPSREETAYATRADAVKPIPSEITMIPMTLKPSATS